MSVHDLHDLLVSICLAEAEQQNAKTQGHKEIPFGLRAWAAFGHACCSVSIFAPLRLCVLPLHPFDLAKQLPW
jgi:hypothetical protein